MNVNLFNNLSINCRNQNNVGAVLQFLKILGREVSSYSSEEDILKKEFIIIYKSGLYTDSYQNKKLKEIKGDDFLEKFAFQAIEFNININEPLEKLKVKALDAKEKMTYCYDNELKTFDGVSSEYYKGIFNFYEEVKNILGETSVLNKSKNVHKINENVEKDIKEIKEQILEVEKEKHKIIENNNKKNKSVRDLNSNLDVGF